MALEKKEDDETRTIDETKNVGDKKDIIEMFRIFTNGNNLRCVFQIIKELGQSSLLSDDKRNNCYVVRCTQNKMEELITNNGTWAIRFERYNGTLYSINI